MQQKALEPTSCWVVAVQLRHRIRTAETEPQQTQRRREASSAARDQTEAGLDVDEDMMDSLSQAVGCR